MAILVTRPAPDNAKTAAALRARGYGVVLAPMLQMEPVAFALDPATPASGVILTSANAARALLPHPARAQLCGLPLFAVGARTAAAAREVGFSDVISADGDSADLRDLIVARSSAGKARGTKTKTKTRLASGPLLYLCGEQLSRDLSAELESRGVAVIVHTIYRMNPVRDLADDARAAFAGGAIDAVMHYSAQSARAFVEAMRAAGLEITALALPQACLSATVAAELREAGASRLIVAPQPDEAALIEALARAVAVPS
ncbi:MAG: uroporphyrinogen-III synthase [Xanthobacteraceae bacterium]|nr:MAG: uroporphyrinogen-III synthase [Xanthobacteraceae bacterium]